MTIATQDLDLIKQEVASIREYYQSRMDSEIPPYKRGSGTGWRPTCPGTRYVA